MCSSQTGTFVRIARIGAAHARRIGLHRLQLLRNGVRILSQPDRVAVRLRHLAAVQTRHLRRRRQERLGFDEDAATRSLEIAEQALAIGERQARVAFKHRARLIHGALVTLLLKEASQLLVARPIATAEALDRFLNLGFEVAAHDRRRG